MGGPQSRTIRGVGCPRFRFLVPGSWGGRLFSVPMSTMPTNSAQPGLSNSSLNDSVQPTPLSLPSSRTLLFFLHGQITRRVLILGMATIFLAPLLYAYAPSSTTPGSFLLRPAAFTRFLPLSPISPNSVEFIYIRILAPASPFLCYTSARITDHVLSARRDSRLCVSQSFLISIFNFPFSQPRLLLFSFPRTLELPFPVSFSENA